MNIRDSYEKIKKRVLFCGVFFIYSLSGILSKFAGIAGIGSIQFFVCYFGILLTMGVYAILWQQLLKCYALSDVFLYKSTTIIWGSIFGVLLFGERISMKKIFGILLILIGIYFVGKKQK